MYSSEQRTKEVVVTSNSTCLINRTGTNPKEFVVVLFGEPKQNTWDYLINPYLYN